MSTELVAGRLSEQVEQVLIGGDLSKLQPAERVHYYKAVCDSVGLNPLTRPFDYLNLNNKLVLYARKDCTDQLRSIHNISVTIPAREMTDGVYVVTARATRPDGRTDESIGAVPVDKLQGEMKANALMKAESKAKRRVTLSICGLGVLDETEVDSIPDARRAPETEKPIDIGGNPMNTQAAANYVRDQKLAVIAKEKEAEPVTIEELAQPAKPEVKPSEDPLWDMVNQRISSGSRADKMQQFEVLRSELAKHLPVEEVQQLFINALEHAGLRTLDDIRLVSQGRKVARELYQALQALSAQEVTA